MTWVTQTVGENALTLPLADSAEGGTQAVWLTIADDQGDYAIPYIQSASELSVRLEIADPQIATVRLTLARGASPEAPGARAAELVVRATQPWAAFAALAPGEYTLAVTGLDAQGVELSRCVYGPLGIGAVIAALGDSLTEGYHGRGFWQDDLHLTADRFPPETVSRDGRNYPQHAPTTWAHKPEVNCFQSWLTTLNDALTESWGHPVFIANEGFGGITSAQYLRKMQHDRNWQARLRHLQPTWWLLHLGVNDERNAVSPAELGVNLEAIVNLLITDYGTAPERILLAKPSYDYWPGADATLRTYCRVIEALILRRRLARGPDFYTVFADAGDLGQREKWYGADPVHPNIAGVEYMARLWAASLVKAAAELT